VKPQLADNFRGQPEFVLLPASPADYAVEIAQQKRLKWLWLMERNVLN